jgi:trans-aconitate 2-methyltransferase
VNARHRRLAAALPEPELARVADLGCGGGRLTAALHRRLGAAETVGVDNSRAMLERARAHAGAGVRFEHGDIAAWDGAGAFDVVLSNAALHWLPDHPGTLARWARGLRAGGQLAAQLPDNRRSLPHRLAAELAGEPPGQTVLDVEDYSRILDELGFARQHVRAQVYLTRLRSRDEAVEWLRGSLLTEYERRLAPERFAGLVADLRAALPDERPFRLPYVRVLLWGGGLQRP